MVNLISRRSPPGCRRCAEVPARRPLVALFSSLPEAAQTTATVAYQAGNAIKGHQRFESRGGRLMSSKRIFSSRTAVVGGL
jgi:hypothetical protein